MSTSSYTEDFDRRDEAEMYLQAAKLDMELNGFELLESDIQYSEDLDRWILRIDYAPMAPVAA